ncbi:hypothetical protein BHE74_00006454 [Ensete ventricosum]|uniref:Uncharacterized protein n=1 Tax=Ensete ventricosum TaxID=4639 RepID=A0A444E6J7_ENSVE|nr:hypothetical protein GW17_00030664 [Ensete ventricosum]RWW84929.1 hypothetical protein BHE74_00006454 [Ensete ventricosum]RZR71519.1 hypothetical protein BHM03_00005597 [Ensete ventricosum]
MTAVSYHSFSPPPIQQRRQLPHQSSLPDPIKSPSLWLKEELFVTGAKQPRREGRKKMLKLWRTSDPIKL